MRAFTHCFSLQLAVTVLRGSRVCGRPENLGVHIVLQRLLKKQVLLLIGTKQLVPAPISTVLNFMLARKGGKPRKIETSQKVSWFFIWDAANSALQRFLMQLFTVLEFYAFYRESKGRKPRKIENFKRVSWFFMPNALDSARSHP